jgi:RNA polymerase sigma factor for flagellar operon FliA
MSQSCERSTQLLAHRDLVVQAARRLMRRLPRNAVAMDELMQAGMIGLNEAISGFDQRGTSFGTYASRRIEGAMLDQLRALDTLPRDVRAQQRKLRAAVQRLEQRLGRAPRAAEVAEELGWSLAALHRCMVAAGGSGLRAGDVPVDEWGDTSSAADETDEGPFSADEDADPLRHLQMRQRLASLSRAYHGLAERERTVMEMLYDRGLQCRQIGQALGVTESRISQIHREVVDKLRHQLRDC